MSRATVIGEEEPAYPASSVPKLTESGPIWRLGNEEHGTSGRSYHNVVRKKGLGSDIRAGQRPSRDGSERFPLARMCDDVVYVEDH
ncbi:hypothetical protein FNV43_RR13072 [Rhamnella rubrinervis]|uniref:Uncharacterized protein n=1 Tax=Rhamnella rubrinervis TaxID=2594499 RepID=A0A8K0MEL3_9ROSA|nr:hypothetical protein FNV43_RR13072 [Rhamnella rubrinervis]